MTDAERLFGRFPPFIQEYIYRQGWEELRDVQMRAAEVILESDQNLLLCSSTASGKTEAVFFPILTDLCEDPPTEAGVGCLYIAPLKSLINDQFWRMEELLDMSGIPVFHWHGDVGSSAKTKFLRDPSGILQITPESLESMLINRSADLVRIFGGLRYIVLDEIHTLIGSDRGNQVLCQLSRLARMTGKHPRRIGLSATIGDPERAGKWLGAGNTRGTKTVLSVDEKLRWRLALEHFYIQENTQNQARSSHEIASKNGKKAVADPGYEYIYDALKDKKALVFSNSREETELVTATLRQIAKNRAEKDRFLIHHGNLSAALREDAELKMKDEDEDAVTCATVTMELGIDIGRLERVLQVDAPNSVSAFLQRLGRSGRRGGASEMIMVFREESPLPNAPLPELIPWGLLRAIAIIQLYIEERFIEPPFIRKMPLSLAFHQTLSVLAASGELSPKALAERVLSLPPMQELPKETYRALLLSMIRSDLLEMTEEKGLIVGMKGERLVSSFKFYAVFKDSEDYTVRNESEEIGTISNPVPQGERFALAGRVWEVLEIDIQRKLIYVKLVDGKMEISWPGDSGEIHTKILQRMRRILFEDTEYPYLMPNAKARLAAARHVARLTHLDQRMFVSLSDTSACLFPWLGTRSFRTLRRYLAKNADVLGISGITSEGCCYMSFKIKTGASDRFLSSLAQKLKTDGVKPEGLLSAAECPVMDKYDDYIPAELLREAYATDRLREDEIMDLFVKEISLEERL